MKKFILWILSYRKGQVDLEEVSRLLRQQIVLLQSASKQISDWQQLALMSQRSARDLAVTFRVAIERPEVDIRDDLDELIKDLSDSVARLEEQIIT